MSHTIKETLAHAEFWAMEAMNSYEHGTEQHKTLKDAYDLIRKASEREEENARQRVYMAAQIR